MGERETAGEMIHGPARVNDFIRQHALMGLGVERATPADLDRNVRACRSATVERLRMARLHMGALRFGSRGVGHHAYDHAVKALATYERTRNREALIDALNYIEIEWLHPVLEGGHWSPVDRAEPTPTPSQCPALYQAGWSHWCAGCRRACDADECPRCGSVLP